MKGYRSFDNFFLSNGSGIESSRTSGFFPSLKDSQRLETSNHFRKQSSVFPYHPLYSDQNALIGHNSQRSSVMYESQITGKQSPLLERSRSQIIQPVYLSPFNKTLGDDLDHSRQLGASKASQITFSKPSEFIINSPKQNVYLENTKKSLIATPQSTTNDYGYTFDNYQSLNPKLKDSLISVTSPMKQSYFSQTLNPCGNSIIINPLPQVVPQIRKNIQSPRQQSNIFNQFNISGTQILKNSSSTGFTIRPSIRRCLSNVSIFSQKSQNKFSQTKIKFNYISPSKNESKMGRKISFKNQDVKNPLSKLSKKKEQKSKIEQNARPKINSEAVNEYFPEFKIKKNRMKIGMSPQAKQVKVIHKVKNHDKSELSEDSQRRNTFIASLDALSQLSEIKPVEKEATKIQEQNLKKIPQRTSEYMSIESTTNIQSSIQSKSIGFNKITGYRITLDGQKVPLASPRKEEVSSTKGSQVSKEVSKDSQLSVNSKKNGEDSEFLKNHGNDSSHTTDYEDEIVKKIKQDLGLHFSYYKKK